MNVATACLGHAAPNTDPDWNAPALSSEASPLRLQTFAQNPDASN